MRKIEVPSNFETAYKGIEIKAASNLHKECLNLIETLELPIRSHVLDLGAGAGAFSQRLFDKGYEVVAVERDSDRFKAGTRCYNLDLNLDFYEKFDEKFDLIVALEIIEHLSNPRHFIGNCLNVLKKDKFLIISSPNLESWVSRLRFLREGRFIWFDEESYNLLGHITPIFSWQIIQICRELKANLVQIYNTKKKFLWNRVGNTFTKIVKSKTFYMGMLYPIMMNRKDGEINIFLIRK